MSHFPLPPSHEGSSSGEREREREREREEADTLRKTGPMDQNEKWSPEFAMLSHLEIVPFLSIFHHLSFLRAGMHPANGIAFEKQREKFRGQRSFLPLFISFRALKSVAIRVSPLTFQLQMCARKRGKIRRREDLLRSKR